MVLWCITATSTVIRNTLLEASGESSKQFFLPFQTSTGNFIWRLKQPEELQSISLGILYFPSQVDLIICFFDQATSEPQNHVHIWWGSVLHRSDREMLNGLLKSNRCCARQPMSISAVINSSATTLSACLLIVTVIQAENFKQMSSSMGRSKHTQYMCMYAYSNVYSFGTDI